MDTKRCQNCAFDEGASSCGVRFSAKLKNFYKKNQKRLVLVFNFVETVVEAVNYNLHRLGTGSEPYIVIGEVVKV